MLNSNKLSSQIIKLISKRLEIIFFIILILISISIYKDYGLNWDALIQRVTGLVSFNYIFSGDEYLFNWPDRDYGVAFELPLVIVEKVLNQADTRDIFLTRHFLIHLFFITSVIFCYKLIYFLYKNKLLAVIGMLIYLLHPRIYAHSFFNSKDIPFMAMFMICFYFFARSFNRKTYLNFAILGITSGLLVNLRIIGVILPGFAIIFLIMDMLNKKQYAKYLKINTWYSLIVIVTVYISWPYLWSDPINNFVTAFEQMSKFRWQGEMLFNGEMITATNLTWKYVPVWFSITTPITYILLGLFGIFSVAIAVINNPLKFIAESKNKNYILYLLCFCTPIISVAVMDSILYDGWRHMYFIYPSIVLLSVYGLNILILSKFKNIVISISAITFSYIITLMIIDHPFQSVYFNNFLPKYKSEYIRKNYELDYWGTSFKQSLEHILNIDAAETINISASNKAIEINLNILKKQDRKRIKFVPIDKADYFITNYRWHPNDYESFEEKAIYSFKVGKNTINKIYKLK